MRKKLLTTKEIKRYIKTHDTIEEVLYCLVFFLVPFVFYLAAHFKYLFDYVDDEELQVYLEAEKKIFSNKNMVISNNSNTLNTNSKDLTAIY